ncbi:hypothetical protein N9468_04610 [Flavobacteriaceae bacterium]|nr:hypothetical protein [Flavobacteriaceae bacterium]
MMNMFDQGRELEIDEVVTCKANEPCHIGGKYRHEGDVFSYVVKAAKGGVAQYLPWCLEEVDRAPVVDPEEPRVTPAGVDLAAPLDVKVRAALTELDPQNADHWTRAGLPAVEVVDQLCGGAGVTRDAIYNAAPTFTRPEVA